MVAAIALGATSMSDIGVLAHLAPVLEAAPSGPTARRALDHLADIRALDARLKAAAAQISALVAATGTTLTSLFGVGPVIAARILAETGDVARFAAKDKLASCNGTPDRRVLRRPGPPPTVPRREPAD
jgi:transposase